MTTFFNWFFFFISIGSLAAVTVLVYIQDNLGRRWGYGIVAFCIGMGLVIFLSGTRRYRFKKLVGSPLTQIASVFIGAWRKRHLELPSDPSLLFNLDDVQITDDARKLKQKLPHSKQFRFLDKAAIKNSEKSGEILKVNKWYLSTSTDVEEVKMVITMVPIWATTIMFWTIYAQMTTFSVSQATTMDRHIGKSFQIPPASLTVFFVGSILLTVPVYDRVVVPLAKRFLKNPQGLTPLQRIGVGLVLSTFAMVSAALTEIKRLRVAQSHGLVDDPSKVVPLSVFWLVPQFFFVGSGEAFTYIGQLDFFLRECPKGMKTMSTGLFLSTLSLGFFVSSLLVTIVHKVTGDSEPWLADNLNKGKLYNFYWLLAVLSVINIGLYLIASRWYVYREHRLAGNIGLPVTGLSWQKNSSEHEAFFLSNYLILQCNKDDDDDEEMIKMWKYTRYFVSDLRPTHKLLGSSSIGVLELGILNANGLTPMKSRNSRGAVDACSVAKYRRKWIRTRTAIESLNPNLNEQYTWEVFDPCTIVTIMVFDKNHFQDVDKGGGSGVRFKNRKSKNQAIDT
nr:protein NRT1/ PTR FAMILY 6.3-like [Tanacetum cinerariifolium]